MEDFDYMEVDLNGEFPGVPNLPGLKQEAFWAPAPPACDAKTISFFGRDLQAGSAKPDIPGDDEEASPILSSDIIFGTENGAAAPNTDWVDDQLQVLSPDDVDMVLRESSDPSAPIVPEVAPSAGSLQFIILPGQEQKPETKRARKNTISLIHEEILAAGDTKSSFVLVPEPDGPDEIIGSLMDHRLDCSDCDTGIMSPSPSSSSAHGDTAECRFYEQSAKRISDIHQERSHNLPHTKKKPMLHEFLGYLLFRRDLDPKLRQSVAFCDEYGNNIRSREASSGPYFRVTNFQMVSEVWKRVKCNSSSDCGKNMKRAMRMSTSYDRQYFVSLEQKMHRQQVFRFGDKSMEIFRRMFP